MTPVHAILCFTNSTDNAGQCGEVIYLFYLCKGFITEKNDIIFQSMVKILYGLALLQYLNWPQVEWCQGKSGGEYINILSHPLIVLTMYSVLFYWNPVSP